MENQKDDDEESNGCQGNERVGYGVSRYAVGVREDHFRVAPPKREQVGGDGIPP